MRSAVLYVFSGTGNTRFAADEIARALSRRGVSDEVFEVRAGRPCPNPREYDLAGFGYPVHAFNAPRFFLRFVRSLAEVEGTRAFLFKTSGEPFHLNSASSLPLVRLLRKKGFFPVMDEHLLMPYNIMFRYPDALAKQMYLHTRDMAEVIAQDLVDGRRQKLRYCPWTAALMLIFRLQWLGARINGPLIHAKKDACTGCGMCARRCPAGNIRMEEGRPHFGSRCTMCMGCAFRCPADAVRPGFLSAWKVNGPYPFEALAREDGVPDRYIGEDTRGYFRLFRRYYARTDARIGALKNQAGEGQEDQG